MDADTSDTDSYAGSAASVASDVAGAEVAIAAAVERAFDPMPFDRTIALEARHSGLLNAEQGDLAAAVARAEAVARECADVYARYDETMQRTLQNLAWLETHIREVDERVKRMYPIERAQAEEQVMRQA